MAGPLFDRIQKLKQAPPKTAPTKEQPKPQPKKKKKKWHPRSEINPETGEYDPFYYKLRMFNGFDDGNFHPTVEMRVVRDDAGNVTGVKQLYRKRRSDDFEWRNIRDFDAEVDNIPAPKPTKEEMSGRRPLSQANAEVQTEPLTCADDGVTHET